MRMHFVMLADMVSKQHACVCIDKQQQHAQGIIIIHTSPMALLWYIVSILYSY